MSTDVIKELKIGKIQGVMVTPKRKIADERGTIMHGVRSDNIQNPFGEVYFKKIYRGVLNAWHVHNTLILNYMCLVGMIKLVLCDTRPESPTYGTLQELFIGEDNHCLVHIPAGIANGSKGLTDPYALLCNVASEPHDPNLKYLRIDPLSEIIPYDWSRKNF